MGKQPRADHYCEWCGRKKVKLFFETSLVCPEDNCDQFSGEENPFDSLELEITRPMLEDEYAAANGYRVWRGRR